MVVKLIVEASLIVEARLIVVSSLELYLIVNLKVNIKLIICLMHINSTPKCHMEFNCHIICTLPKPLFLVHGFTAIRPTSHAKDGVHLNLF